MKKVCFYSLFFHTQIIPRAQGVPQPRRELSSDSQKKYEKAVNFNPARLRLSLIAGLKRSSLRQVDCACACLVLSVLPEAPRLCSLINIFSPSHSSHFSKHHWITELIKVWWRGWYDHCQSSDGRLLHSLERLGADLIKVCTSSNYS